MLTVDVLESYDDIPELVLLNHVDEDSCRCGGTYEGVNPYRVRCYKCGDVRADDRYEAIAKLYDCGTVRVSDADEAYYKAVLSGDADYEPAGRGMLDYRLTTRGRLTMRNWLAGSRKPDVWR